MRFASILVMVVTAFGARSALGQTQAPIGWQVAATFGPYRVDHLAGTPFVPRLEVTKATRSAAVSASLAGIYDAGFYSLSAISLDLGVGVRRGTERAEGLVQIGPTTLLGGDSDGTPYLGFGGHLTASGTYWLGSRVGLTGGATGRVWFTTGNTRFSPSGSFGLRFRL